MAYYTIKQLVDIFHISRQWIQKLLKKPEYQSHLAKRRIKGRSIMVVDEQGYQLLKKYFDESNESNNSNNCESNTSNGSETNERNQQSSYETVANDVLVSELRKQINSLHEELTHAHQELDRVHTELQHEQELHLMDKKELAKEREEMKQLQATSKQEESNNFESSETNESNNESIKKEPPVKKWWQFWK